ncbi:MAG: hypothetical protein JW937_10400 [Candidatus Omnitrophica bacterium]|nr:hypothetical protein [Candidatus Omnitrophota bacterium]
MQYSKPTLFELRNFGFVLAGILCAFGGLFHWRHGELNWAVYGLFPLASALSGLCWPPLLFPVHRVLTWLGGILGWVNTRIILGLTFYLVAAPIGLLMRLLGKDPMQRKLFPGQETYWIPSEHKRSPKEEFETPY